MLNAIKPLIDSGIINESTQAAITEAWEAQLSEAKEAVRAELREEFARRYEHDKNKMVDALDKLVTESLRSEIVEFQEEKRAMASDRVNSRKEMREHAEKFHKFLIQNLAKEIKELQEERQLHHATMGKIKSFVANQLASELKEFAIDKRDLVETKVRVITQGKKQIAETRKQLIAKTAKLVEESVSNGLKQELSQLKEDIQVARENLFGRRIFEAFASEFTTTHLNENQEIAKLRALVKAKDRQLDESKDQVAKVKALVESKDQQLSQLTESVNRKQVLADLLAPLNKDKAKVMSELLESVGTSKLQAAYDKYLPAVLGNATANVTTKKQVITESVTSEVTGNKAATNVDSDSDNVVEIRKLAGLK